MPQVDQVGQMCPLVQLDGRGDLDHLQERDGAFLHAGAAGTRRRQQRQPLAGGALHGRGDPFGRGDPDRPGQEIELAGHHRDPPPEYAALAGQHRFVQAGGGRRGGQLPPVRLAGGNRQRRGVPAGKRSRVEHGIA